MGSSSAWASRALAAEPAMLLMDEPFGAVDAIVRASLQEETRALQRRTGATILFVTHDVEEALLLADVLVVMREGHIEQSGSPSEILMHPATPFVSELVDADDVLRRLSVVTLGQLAARTEPHPLNPAQPAAMPELDERLSLRDALATMLETGASRVRVLRDGREAAVLDLDALRRAVRR